MPNLLKIDEYKNAIKLVLNKNSSLKNLKNISVLITGASGLIASAVADILIFLNKNFNTNIKIFLSARNITSLQERFENNEYNAILWDATKEFTNLEFHSNLDYIIHAASNASPDLYVKEPVETMYSNLFGTNEMLKLAKSHSAKMIFISSSEIYGQIITNEPIKENESAFVDLLNPRSCYASSKRAAETLCVAFASEYGINVSIIRPGHIYGPSARASDIRVSSAFAYAAAHGDDIVMKSSGSQVRSYTHALDCATAILCVMINGKNCEAYNIANPNSNVSIKTMAENLATCAGVKLKMDLPTDTEKSAFNPMQNSSLDSSKLLRLDWEPVFDIQNGMKNTINTLKSMGGGEHKIALMPPYHKKVA